MRRIILSWIFASILGCILICLSLTSCEDKIETPPYIKQVSNIDYTLYPRYYEKDKCIVYCNLEGEIVINDDYVYANSFFNDVAIVKQGSHSSNYYYINTDGEKVGTHEYYIANPYYNDYAIVKKRSYDGYIYIDQNGEHAIHGEYAIADLYNDKLAPVKDEIYTTEYSYNRSTETAEYKYDFYYYINNEGEVMIDNKDYIVAKPFYKGYAVAAIAENLQGTSYNTKYGLINTKGEVQVNFDYDDAQIYCTEGLLAVKEHDDWGFVNTKGKLVVDFDYAYAYPYLEGFAAVREDDDTWTFIDKKGKESNFSYAFENINYGFSEGLAAVKYNGRWGYINTSGDFVIEPQFEDTPSPFINGYAQCENGIISNKGALLFSIASPIYKKRTALDKKNEEHNSALNQLLFNNIR